MRKDIDYGQPPSGPVAIGWCVEHQRIETDWQAINELTREYIDRHSELVSWIFGDN